MSGTEEDNFRARESGSGTEEVSDKTTEKILDGVDRGFEIYGKNVKEIFYNQMEESIGIRRSDILNKPDLFERALLQFFTVGKTIVDRTIGKQILHEFKLPEVAGLNFRTAIEIVRRHPGS